MKASCLVQNLSQWIAQVTEQPNFVGGQNVLNLLYLLNASQGNIFIIVSSQNSIFKFQGTLYTGLLDGRIVKLEGDKVIDVVQTGKPPCGKWHILCLLFKCMHLHVYPP